MEYKDYYDLLGISRTASAEEIKRAYRKKARKYHPDVSKERDAETRFKEVQEAYEVLKDPEKRQAYDHLGSNWKQGQEFRPPPDWGQEFHFGHGGPGAGMFSDFFESLFGQGGFDFGTRAGPGAARPGRGRRGDDQTHRIELSVEEAYRGVQRTLQLQLVEPAGPGPGARRGRTLNVRIPAGVTEGQKIRLSGQGSPGMAGGAAGHLLLEVHIRPHPLYKLEGSDIVLTLPVAPWEAALGGRIEVPTPGGQVAITIAPGSQSGKRHRLRGRGMPGKTPGDLYAVLNIVNPPVESEEARTLFERMARALPFDPRGHLK
jgi:curved DNA-binding protein